MSDLQSDNAKKLFNLAKLAEASEVKAEAEDESTHDNMRLKKFFRPTILNLSDMQEPSPATI